jgi:predicted phage-related endonuclease
VAKTAWKDSTLYKMKGKNVMSTVEFLILHIEEEAKKAEEKRIISKIEQLKELESLIEEAKNEAEILKGEIKEELEKRNTEEMSVGKYIVRWTEVISNRFDTTAFKKLFPEAYKSFTKPSMSRRFSISG